METSRQSPRRANICITENENQQVVHMKIIDPTDAAFERYCLNEAASALLRPCPIYEGVIWKFEFKDRTEIPLFDATPDEEYLDKLQRMARQKDRVQGPIDSYSSEPLRPYIAKLIDNTPSDLLSEKYGISPEEAKQTYRIHYLCFENQDLTADILHANGFQECSLWKIPMKNRVFSLTDTGKKNMQQFHDFLAGHFFDPQLTIDKLVIISALYHSSQMPPNIDSFDPQNTNFEKLFDFDTPDTTAFADVCSIEEYDFEPYPENYMHFAPHNSDLSKSYDIAILLYAEYGTFIPQKAPDDKFSFAEQFEPLSEKFPECNDPHSYSEIMNQSKALATQIIQEQGYRIRGREQTPQEESLHPSSKRGIHM